MRFLWTVIRKDWTRVRHDPFSLATSLAIPILLSAMMCLIFGRETPLPQGRLLVADGDDTIASNILVGPFNRDPLSKMVLVERVTESEGRARMNHGDASALLVIPPGFQEAFLQNQPFHLLLITNPSERIMPQVIQESLSIVVDGAFYVQRIAGAELRALHQPARTIEGWITAGSAMAAGLVGQLRRYLNPMAMELTTEVSAAPQKERSFASMFLPSMLFMGLMLIAGSLAQDIWKERMMGTLRRLAVSPAPLSSYLLARLIFVVSVYAVVALIGLAAAHWIAGVPVHNLATATIWLTFSGCAFFLILLYTSVSASTARAANVMNNLILFPLAMIGGCFFPFDWMPQWMARVGKLTPNGWAITQFIDILNGEIQARQMWIAIMGLTGVSLLMFLLALRKLQKGFVV